MTSVSVYFIFVCFSVLFWELAHFCFLSVCVCVCVCECECVCVCVFLCMYAVNPLSHPFALLMKCNTEVCVCANARAGRPCGRCLNWSSPADVALSLTACDRSLWP